MSVTIEEGGKWLHSLASMYAYIRKKRWLQLPVVWERTGRWKGAGRAAFLTRAFIAAPSVRVCVCVCVCAATPVAVAISGGSRSL